MSKPLTLSLIIPTRNRPQQLQCCLDSLKAVLDDSDAEILVVDDCSHPRIKELNRAQCAARGLHLHVQPKRLGPAAARMLGVERARGEWVAFIDDDCTASPQWYATLQRAVHNQAAECVGIEGATHPRGCGLWDRMVENVRGGLYLTSNIIYRRDILIQAGGFDRRFKAPFCEDQECAARMLQHGTIVFIQDIVVYHQPRAVPLLRYIAHSPARISALLKAEMLFFILHRDRYWRFRHARSFWGTWRAVAFKNFVTPLRMAPNAMRRHPLSWLSFLLASGIEQGCAIILLPFLLMRYSRMLNRIQPPALDWNTTGVRWGISAQQAERVLKLRPSLVASACFGITHKPVYSALPQLRALSRLSTLDRPRLYLRIDDVSATNQIHFNKLCALLEEQSIPCCAAVTGEDLAGNEATTCIERLKDVNAEIALHGFTHRGTFGPYASELLQLSLPELSRTLDTYLQMLPQHHRPPIFIPPFNAINRLQLHALGSRFAIVCTGPESARFIGYRQGPLWSQSGAVYFPSYWPFYTTAHSFIKQPLMHHLATLRGHICISVHMAQEARDGFSALRTLLRHHRALFVPWQTLLSQVECA